MAIFLRGNDALITNPATEVTDSLSIDGSDWLWAVTAIFVASFFGLLILCFTSRESDRVFHYLFTVVLLTGSVTYYAQASNLGWTVAVEHGLTRQLSFAKYINWLVAFPSMSLALGLLSGVSWTTISTNIFISWFWVLTYLAAAYTPSDYKWGFFGFGTFAWIILAMSTLNESYESAVRLGVGRDYIVLSGWVNLLWLLYPIAFGLSDGGDRLDVTGGSVLFGILDVLFVPGSTFGFMVMARKWDYATLGLAFSEYRINSRSEISQGKGAAPAVGGVSLDA